MTWPTVLEQLRLQMSQATYDQWLAGTRLVDEADGVYRVAVASEAGREWLANRLNSVIERTIRQVTGQTVAGVEYVVSRTNGHSPAPAGRESIPPEVAPTRSGLAGLDYEKLLTGTGYSKLHHYHSVFWRRYLGRAFDLWSYLQSRPMTKADLAVGWTPARRYRFKELATALGASINSIRGGEENCYHLRQAAKFGQPLEQCCGRYDEVRWGGGRCVHWRTGWLEILYQEGLLAVEESKAPSRQAARSHLLRLQVWRTLPILTPWQVSQLKERDQERHDRWLEKYGHLVDFGREAWEAETAPSAVRMMTNPDYTEGRTLFDAYEPNTLKAPKF